jgi:D-alanyl-D-alanine dipeptidase
MSKKLGGILVLLVGGGLMLYSMARTFHLLSATLPPGQEVLAIIALLGFDGGLVAWTTIFLRGAEGGFQRSIALLMVLVDLVGVVAGFLGDTLLTSGEVGLLAAMDAGSKQTIILVTAFVIAANIAAVIFYHIADPASLRRMTEENARDKITSQALAAIAQQANVLAEELAPVIAADWVRSMRADFSAALIDRDVKQLPAARPVRRVVVQSQPSAIDRMKSRLSEAIAPASGEVVTLASEGEAIEVEDEERGVPIEDVVTGIMRSLKPDQAKAVQESARDIAEKLGVEPAPKARRRAAK